MRNSIIMLMVLIYEILLSRDFSSSMLAGDYSRLLSKSAMNFLAA